MTSSINLEDEASPTSLVGGGACRVGWQVRLVGVKFITSPYPRRGEGQKVRWRFMA